MPNNARCYTADFKEDCHMFCAACGQRIKDGARFCDNCGAPLQAPGGVATREPASPMRIRGNSTADPYKEQIAELKLQLKQLKLYLKQTTSNMSVTRSQYNQTSAFVPHGLMKHGYKWFEDFRLWGPQRQKQQLQQEVMQMEQQLLGLQQAQAQWRRQQ
jgi:predicted amidophosphoribosyltransferase